MIILVDFNSNYLDRSSLNDHNLFGSIKHIDSKMPSTCIFSSFILFIFIWMWSSINIEMCQLSYCLKLVNLLIITMVHLECWKVDLNELFKYDNDFIDRTNLSSGLMFLQLQNLLNSYNDVSSSQDISIYTGAIFIDLPKAFDMVDHYLLRDKPCTIGLSKHFSNRFWKKVFSTVHLLGRCFSVY